MLAVSFKLGSVIFEGLCKAASSFAALDCVGGGVLHLVLSVIFTLFTLRDSAARFLLCMCFALSCFAMIRSKFFVRNVCALEFQRTCNECEMHLYVYVCDLYYSLLSFAFDLSLDKVQEGIELTEGVVDGVQHQPQEGGQDAAQELVGHLHVAVRHGLLRGETKAEARGQDGGTQQGHQGAVASHEGVLLPHQAVDGEEQHDAACGGLEGPAELAATETQALLVVGVAHRHGGADGTSDDEHGDEAVCGHGSGEDLWDHVSKLFV